MKITVNGQPAAEEYARLIGVPLDELGPERPVRAPEEGLRDDLLGDVRVDLDAGRGRVQRAGRGFSRAIAAGEPDRLQRGPARGLKGKQDNKGIFQHIIVKGTEKLGNEQRLEAAFA